MGFREWIAHKVLKLPTREELLQEYSSGIPYGQAPNDELDYRPIHRTKGKSWTERDLLPLNYEKHLKMSHYLWMTHPVARRAIQLRRDLVVGNGIELRALDSPAISQVQEILDDYWLTNWEGKLVPRVESLSVFGELILHCPPHNPYSGGYECGIVLPEQVESISLSPSNAEKTVSIQLKEPIEIAHPDGTVIRKRNLSVISRSGNKVSGDTLYMGINRLCGATRGLSDLLPVIDWLDQLDQVFYTEVERLQLSRGLVYVCTLRNATPRRIQEVRDFYRTNPIHPGSVLITSEDEQWELRSPNLMLGDSKEFLRWLLLFCWGALGLPEHWYAEANTVNKASSENMETPVFAWVRVRREELLNLISLGVEHRLQCAMQCGALPEGLEFSSLYEIKSLDPDRTAYDVIGTMLKAIGDALTQATMEGWITSTDAGNAFRTVARSVGLGDFSDSESTDESGLAQAREKAESELQWKRPALESIPV